METRPKLTDFDLFLYGKGTHYRAYEKLGAHLLEENGESGAYFAVWAPNAETVSVIGSFNNWEAWIHQMHPINGSGIWELFIPGVKEGDQYKFEIKGPDGFWGQKSDPYAFYAEIRPRTASIVYDLSRYQWNDADWMAQRPQAKWHEKPISVYEVHLGSWKRGDGLRWLTYRELAEQLVPYATEMGYTHIELMPIAEHPFDGSWGYQTSGYYAPTSRFGTPDDFRYLVDRCHQNGLGVILDWVPAHFPKDAHGLGYFDGTHLYEHSDPRQGEHRDWGTLIFNYGRNEVSGFLLSNAAFWAREYHLDGMRVDAVASMLYLDYSREAGQWIPNRYGGRENLEAIEFLKHFNSILHREFPGILTFAEESTAFPQVSHPVENGGLGFDFKWNMGWMNDTLKYFSKDPIHRKYHQGDLTFSMIYAFTENFILPFSHDEVVHGKASLLDKMPGDFWQKFANMRLLFAYMFAHPGKKLLFMGCEIGQWREWDAATSLDWNLLDFEPHQKLKILVAKLNELYTGQAALYDIESSWEGFDWIDFQDAENSVISFLRKGRDSREIIVCILNLTPTPRNGYRIGLPQPDKWAVILNTDAETYGGSNAGPEEGRIFDAHHLPWHDKGFSVQLDLPPLGALMLKSVRNPDKQ
ncbi:MAG: 1,4-alpha-glucan branching enzyme [Verrucomicrobiota bacterium]|jgi:1,4-alpha-glucan branching enzyme|nr:1,4-alpha-glucan branching enzyme [Verrucomicrobiota bacterium]MDK2964241.1 1,4-alpha-glucan branching enzyme [Verrucomicrobiota bacterium]